jgi:serine/threonine protein kinase
MAKTNPLAPFQSVPPAAGAAEDPLIGVALGDRYRITRLIGSGGMARVYEAVHRVIHRKVAVKVLLSHLASDNDLVRRFVNEGRAAGTIGHPNIVESLDMGTAPDGSPYLVLEYLEGISLADELYRTGALAIDRAAYIALQIASALSAAHARGIVHRDMKPENVFLTQRDGRADHVKILDFGVSKFTAASVGVVGETVRGALIGTPEYMAPEQIGGEDEIDGRTDVYAIGMLLYEMIAGRAAFAGRGATTQVLRAVLVEEPAPLEQLRPAVQPELAAIVRRALAKRPEDRWASAEEFAAQIEPFAGLDERPSGVLNRAGTYLRPTPVRVTPNPALQSGAITVSVRPAGPTGLTPEIARSRSSGTHTPLVETPPPATSSPRRTGWLPWAALAVVLAVGIGVFAARGKLSPTPNTSPSQAAATPSVTTDQASNSQVRFTVRTNAPSASAIVRGESVPLPNAWLTRPGNSPELVGISAPGFETRVYRVVFDRDRLLVATLTPGTGSHTASDAENAAALGEASPLPTATTAAASAFPAASASTVLPDAGARPTYAGKPFLPPTKRPLDPSTSASALPLFDKR